MTHLIFIGWYFSEPIYASVPHIAPTATSICPFCGQT